MVRPRCRGWYVEDRCENSVKVDRKAEGPTQTYSCLSLDQRLSTESRCPHLEKESILDRHQG